MIDVTAARIHLAEKLPVDEQVEITDESVLDAAVAIVAARTAGA
jgi:hypothetical protein